MNCVLAVDVGTASVRCGVFDTAGSCLSSADQPIPVRNSQSNLFEQSTEQIWSGVCQTVRKSINQLLSSSSPWSSRGCSVDDFRVMAISFDATCSLVVQLDPVLLDDDDIRLELTNSGLTLPEWDVIMWMDLRAEKEARYLSSGNFSPIETLYSGIVSAETDICKIVWLKNNCPLLLRKGHIRSLVDYLVFKCTGRWLTSCNAAGTKMTFAKETAGFSEEFFQQIGLDSSLFGEVASVGRKEPLLKSIALEDFGLPASAIYDGIVAGVGLIDAYAGWLGAIGCQLTASAQMENRLVIIAGSSACHLACSKSNRGNVRHMWGPFYGVVLPDMWIYEAGQSAAGLLLDDVLKRHPASERLGRSLSDQHSALLHHINDYGYERLTNDAKHIHFYPDIHGNRSPIGDNNLRAMKCGFGLVPIDEKRLLDDLAADYLAAVQSLALSSRWICEEFSQQCGLRFDQVVITGGLARNWLYCRVHADVLGVPLVLPVSESCVLLGTAMVADSAYSGRSLEESLSKMSCSGEVVEPSQDELLKSCLSAKYKVFRRMFIDQNEYRALMA